jgi:SAM-dependent methyltransferase
MILKINNDPFGAAVLEYYKFRYRFAQIRVFSNVSGNEKINPSYLFRSYKNMPVLEQKALGLCRGKILDVGAGAGSHTLHLQNLGFSVCSIDISPGCCKVMKKRGVSEVYCTDFFNFTTDSYDTILLLMNGIGIAGTIEGLKDLLRHSRSLLKDNGQILFDSSDIEHIFYEKDGSKWINLNSIYYGEVNYKLSYKKIKGKSFGWLFVDSDTLAAVADEEGFVFEKLAEGTHNDYLGKLKQK